MINMKQIIPFKKELLFKTKVSEITSISLEHALTLKKDDLISGEFHITGDYKMTEGSINREKFDFKLPFDIALDSRYDISSIIIDIDNFYSYADTSFMMTMHSAKGLEFPIVFIAGVEDGLFPSIASVMNPEELNEERRLAYVGITRAKEKLYLTKTNSRMLYGSTTYNKISRFVDEIPKELLEYTGGTKMQTAHGFGYSSASSDTIAVGRTSKSSYSPKAFGYVQPAAKSGVVYSVGDTVLHKVFGKGMITKTEKMGNDTMLEIAFETKGTKTLMANFCKMEKL